MLLTTPGCAVNGRCLLRWIPTVALAAILLVDPRGVQAQAVAPVVPPPAAPVAPAAPAVGAPVVPGALPERPGTAVALPPPPSASLPARSAPSGAAASAPRRLFRLEGTLPVEDGAAAVAINADESLLAVAREDGSTAQILIFDRPSKTRIGVISAKVGAAPRIVFSPQQDLLLVAGSKGVQLWDVPIVPLKPDQPLDERYRLWEQSLSGSGSTPQIGFSDPPTHAVWSRGAELFRREASAAGPNADKPVWRADGDRRISGFAYGRNGAGLALFFAGEKGIDLLDSRALTLLGSLTGHRFPVAGIAPSGKGWLSLDTGRHLLRWSENLQQQESTYLEHLASSGEPAFFRLLGARHVLIAVPGPGGGSVQRIATSPPAWRVEDQVSALADGLAVSPTGRYVLALEGAKGEPAKLYGFAAPESPLDYVRRLQAAKAYRAAQGYVRLLDDSGLTPKLKSSLLSELSQVPVSVKVQDFQERLARARRDNNADAIRHWAEQILNLRPQDPDALAALKDLKTQSERRILNQAREALKQGQTAQVIAVLSSQISADSALQEEAAAVIKEAEAQRRITGLLGQAREQMAARNYPAASALVQEALRENKDDPAARSLLSEIQDRSGERPYPRWIPIGAGMMLALAVVGFLVYRNRSRLMPRFRSPEPVGTSPWGGLRGGLGAGSGREGAEGGFGPSTSGPSRPKPSPVAPGPGPRPAPRAPGGAGATVRKEAPEARKSASRDGSASTRTARAESARPAHVSRSAERQAERQRPPQPSPARLQVVEELLQRTEDMMRLAQQADVAREHTSMLMELEAELAAFHRRISDPAVDLGPVHQRLKSLNAQLRELKFTRRETPPPKPPSPEPPPGEPTWYEVLQVAEGASDGEIRASYHRLLKQYHPDLHNHSDFPWVREQAEQMTKKLGTAFQVLGNPDKRQEYDRTLRRRRN